MKIHVGVVTHKHGENVYAGLDEGSLVHQVATYCREWWKRDGPQEDMPDSDDGVVSRYFDWVAEIGGDESYSSHEVEVI